MRPVICGLVCVCVHSRHDCRMQNKQQLYSDVNANNYRKVLIDVTHTVSGTKMDFFEGDYCLN